MSGFSAKIRCSARFSRELRPTMRKASENVINGASKSLRGLPPMDKSTG
jgi:hypothetical protein